MTRAFISWGSLLLLTACSVFLPAAAPVNLPTLSPIPSPTPVPWSALGLAGQLVFTRGHTEGVAKLDLASGTLTTLFQPPPDSWGLNEAAVSPDNQSVVISYAPPLSPTEMQFGYTSLYWLPVDGSAPPQPLIRLNDPHESYGMPTWSPDGRYLYYVHSKPAYDARGDPIATQYQLERRLYPDGQPEVILQDALWPRLSPDGSKLVYVPALPATDANQLYLANADGTEIRPLIPDGTFESVDTPLFTPDGTMILFNAVGAKPAASAPLTSLDRWLGVQVAAAHPNAADWWRVPLTGGQPQAVTEHNFSSANMQGDFAPDGQHLAFTTYERLYVMNPDGSNLRPIFNLNAVGTVDWMPLRID